MSPQAKHINGFAYIAARERAEHLVAQLAEAQRIQVNVDIDPDGVPSTLVAHQVQLTYGRFTRVVTVDHDTFMDPEFFRTLVLHQIQAAIDELVRLAS